MINYETNALAHHGVLGMKWGVRRYQKKDGSLTALGKKRQRQETNQKMLKKSNELRKRADKYAEKAEEHERNWDGRKAYYEDSNRKKANKLYSDAEKLKPSYKSNTAKGQALVSGFFLTPAIAGATALALKKTSISTGKKALISMGVGIMAVPAMAIYGYSDAKKAQNKAKKEYGIE